MTRDMGERVVDRIGSILDKWSPSIGILLFGVVLGMLGIGGLGIPSVLHNDTLVGAAVGALGAVVGGWLGAALVARRDDLRQAREEERESRRTRRDVAAALRAVLAEATANAVDIDQFIQRGEAATTKLADGDYRLYHELLVRHLPTDVYFVFVASYRQLAFAQRHFVSGKTPRDLSRHELEELEYVRISMTRVGALARGVLRHDYQEVEPAVDPRETIRRYLADEDGAERADREVQPADPP